MTSANSIQIVSSSSEHYVLTVQSLPIDAAIAHQFTRFPQEQWPHIIPLILSMGLEFVGQLDSDHIAKIAQVRQLEELQRTLTLEHKTRGFGQEQDAILRQILKHHVESLFDDWQQRLTKSLENRITPKAREDPENDHKNPDV